MARFVTALALLVLPLAAEASGGVGVVVNPMAISLQSHDYAKGVDIGSPGALFCGGMQGFSEDGGRRIGAEARWCGGPDSRMSWYGIQSGWKTPGGGWYLTGYSGLGGGHLRVQDEGGLLRQYFIYVQPTIGFGVPVAGIGALEVTGFIHMPITVSQRYNGHRYGGGEAYLWVGAQAAVLFGDFGSGRGGRNARKNKKDVPLEGWEELDTDYSGEPAPLDEADEPHNPAAPRGDGQPAPVQPGDAPAPPDDGSDNPVAIPI